MKQLMNRAHFSVLFTLACSVVLVLSQGCDMGASFEQQLKDAAAEVNEECPVMVDEETRLDKAIARSSDVFEYQYTLISMRTDEVDTAAIKNFMEPHLINGVKTNPNLSIFRENNVTMVYAYRDMVGDPLMKITITPDDYNAATTQGEEL